MVDPGKARADAPVLLGATGAPAGKMLFPALSQLRGRWWHRHHRADTQASGGCVRARHPLHAYARPLAVPAPMGPGTAAAGGRFCELDHRWLQRAPAGLRVAEPRCVSITVG
jgi:hypothetical protein